jgi:hypothetical protein
MDPDAQSTSAETASCLSFCLTIATAARRIHVDPADSNHAHDRSDRLSGLADTEEVMDY